MTDPIIQTKTCRHCQKSFDITQGDLDFYDKISRGLPGYQESPHGERKDLSGVDKLGVRIPTPTLCPECRQRRRLSFRNERKLYRRKCDASGKDIISIYSPDKPFRVYDQKIRRSDERDPMSYGRDFDFTRSFTEQFGELMKEVPRWGLINTNSNSNSSYTNFTDSSENIYMCSDVYQCKDVLYAHTIKNIQNSIDLLDVTNSQESYYCSFSSDLYNCKFVVFSKNCSTSSYLSYCVNLQQSAYCVGLENQSYCILNRPYSRNEYYHILDTMSHDKLFYDYSLLLEQYSKPLRLINCENAQGNNLANCKNCKEVYFAQSVTNSRYIYIGYNMDQCMDTTIHNIDCYLDYEACSGGKLKYCGFNMLGRGGEYIFYTQECINSSHLFGCIGLRNKSYCIFNKQYTKQEYEELVPKIIAHMESTGERGEFFHPSLSPFGYNETVAMEYYPLSPSGEERGLGGEDDFGYHRSTYEPAVPQVDKVIAGQHLPDSIDQVTDDILKIAILCEVTKKPFRITPQELLFYRKHDIPLPRKHPDVRHEERMKLRK